MSNKFKFFSVIAVIVVCLVVFNGLSRSEITSSQYRDLKNIAIEYGDVDICFILLERRFEDNKIALWEYKEIKSCYNQFAHDSLHETIISINTGDEQ